MKSIPYSNNPSKTSVLESRMIRKDHVRFGGRSVEKYRLHMLRWQLATFLPYLRQETKKGQRQRARKGMWIGGIPFGYCKGLCANCEDPNGKDYCPNYGGKNLGDGKNIIAHPIESLAVKMAFDWYATGNYTQVQIVHILNETKVRLPDGSEVQLRQKGRKGATNPGLFGRDTIRDMLKRYSYTGKIPYQGIDEQGRHRKRKPPLEVLDGNHPALVSEELFNKVQEILALVNKNIRYKNGNPVRLYPLTGILRCGYCGSRMRGEKTFLDRRVYGDGDRIDHKNNCMQPMADSDVVEEHMYYFLREVIENSKGKVDLDVLQKEIQLAEQRFLRTRDIYISGEITREVFEIERNRLESLKRDLRFDFVGATMTSLSFIRSGVAEWNTLSQFEQKRLLQLAIEAAWVRENAIVAVQPSIAFLSLLSTYSDGNMGEMGIRTPGRVNPGTHLAGEPNQPLWHLPNLLKLRAEGVGFEPTVGCPTLVFKTSALGRSAIPPSRVRPILSHIPRAGKEMNPRQARGALTSCRQAFPGLRASQAPC